MERSPTKTTLRRKEPYKMPKRTIKPLRGRVLIEEDLAVSSKNRARQNAKKSKTTKMKFSQKKA